MAFAAWLGVHALLMTGVRNRIDAFVAWGWDNFSSGRGPQVLDRSEAAHIDWGDDEPQPGRSQPALARAQRDRRRGGHHDDDARLRGGAPAAQEA